MQTLLAAIQPYYDPARIPDSRYVHASKRSFHRERNFAIVLTKLDSARRSSEICSLKLGDFQQTESFSKERHGRSLRAVTLFFCCWQALSA